MFTIFFFTIFLNYGECYKMLQSDRRYNANDDVTMNFKFAKNEEISFATYNIWNTMFHWNIRKLRIAQMIKELSPDIIGLQEVRGDFENVSQLHELNELLSGQYTNMMYAPAHLVKPIKGSYVQGFRMEGIGILSKYPIITSQVIKLERSFHEDPLTRVIVHAQIRVSNEASNDIVLNVFVVHLSYAREQQCNNVAQLRQYIKKGNYKHIVILGDFNTYIDYDLPVRYLTGGGSDMRDKCQVTIDLNKALTFPTPMVADAWMMIHGAEDPGYTFSNMPSPGLVSRPDRILITNDLVPLTVTLHGDGAQYKQRYYAHIMWQRFYEVRTTLWAAFQGYQGYSCQHDCGPHASCRCGVCVGGLLQNANACQLQSCNECNAVYLYLLWFLILLTLLFTIQLLYSLLRILLTKSRRTREQVKYYLGANCCLCDRQLYEPIDNPRNYRRYLPWNSLSACGMLAFSVACLLVHSVLLHLVLKGLIDDVRRTLSEEFYTSDHLMLHAKFKLKFY